MKKQKRINSLTAISLMLVLSFLLLWAGSMFFVTNAVAQNYYQLLLRDSRDFADYVTTVGRLESLIVKDDNYEYFQSMPGYKDYRMLDAITYTNRKNLDYSYGYDRNSNSGWLNFKNLNVLKDSRVPMQTAVIFLDKDGRVLHNSSDFIYFSYIRDDEWEKGIEEEYSGNAWMDLSQDEKFPLFRSMYGEAKSILDIRVLRIRGKFQGAEIKPFKIDYISYDMVREALDKTEPDHFQLDNNGDYSINYRYTYSGLDHEGLLDWQTIYDELESIETPDELVTIYAMYPQANFYNPGGEVSHQGEKYKNLYEVLSMGARDIYSREENQLHNYNLYGLDELMIFDSRSFADLTNYDHFSNEPFPEPEFIMLTAIASKPLRVAISKLAYVYIWTFLLALLGALTIRKQIKEKLILPLEAINQGISRDWIHIHSIIESPAKWREVYDLGEHYKDTQDKLRINKNEITRLNTALDYVKTAEKNRRQMISSIAHELKTPLSVIHSYAEGLKEHIAEGKRDKYLEVILSEAERMDGVVLEMLDLSRLEAGKVKLSRDNFSLTNLTKTIFEKLEMAAEVKNLHITFDFQGECNVSADEARISQVIENFATNAIKYTPIKGEVHVGIYRERAATTFAIANDCEPLSSEELSKIWNPFYRRSQARSSGGTGLGLSIAKNIIELHGGSYSVKNMKSGVEFKFTI